MIVCWTSKWVKTGRNVQSCWQCKVLPCVIASVPSVFSHCLMKTWAAICTVMWIYTQRRRLNHVTLHIQGWSTEAENEAEKVEGRKSEFKRKASGTEHRPDSDSSENKNIHCRWPSSQQHMYTEKHHQGYKPFHSPTSNKSLCFLN